FALVGPTAVLGVVFITFIARHTAQECHMLDHLAQALQNQHAKRDQNHCFQRIARQSAGIRALLQYRPGAFDVTEAEIQRKNAERDQKHERAKNIDPGFGFGAQTTVNDVDAYMAVTFQNISRTQHDDQIKRISLHSQIDVAAELDADVLTQIAGDDPVNAKQNQAPCPPPHDLADERPPRIDSA